MQTKHVNFTKEQNIYLQWATKLSLRDIKNKTIILSLWKRITVGIYSLN